MRSLQGEHNDFPIVFYISYRFFFFFFPANEQVKNNCKINHARRQNQHCRRWHYVCYQSSEFRLTRHVLSCPFKQHSASLSRCPRTIWIWHLRNTRSKNERFARTNDIVHSGSPGKRSGRRFRAPRVNIALPYVDSSLRRLSRSPRYRYNVKYYNFRDFKFSHCYDIIRCYRCYSVTGAGDPRRQTSFIR